MCYVKEMSINKTLSKFLKLLTEMEYHIPKACVGN